MSRHSHPFHTVRHGRLAHYPPKHEAPSWTRGDFILTQGSSPFSRLIRFGERLRFRGPDSKFAYWNHAALVASDSGELIEVERPGVIRSPASKYRDKHYVLVDVDASSQDRDEIVAFGEWCLHNHKPASRLDFFTIGFNLLTGARLTLFLDGDMICSGLVARAQERAGVIFSMDPSLVMPADLAKYYDAAPPPGTGP